MCKEIIHAGIKFMLVLGMVLPLGHAVPALADWDRDHHDAGHDRDYHDRDYHDWDHHDRDHERGHDWDHHRAMVDRHMRHFYREGHWYRPGWFGWNVRVPTLGIGVYVDSLPSTYRPVVIGGQTYYYGDNTYFSPLPEGGYTVVMPPGR